MLRLTLRDHCESSMEGRDLSSRYDMTALFLGCIGAHGSLARGLEADILPFLDSHSPEVRQAAQQALQQIKGP